MYISDQQVSGSVEDAITGLEAMGGILHGHFTFPVFPSVSRGARVHGDTYVSREKIYVDPGILTIFAKEIAGLVHSHRIDAVVSDKNGQVLSYAVALHLSSKTGTTIHSIVATKKRHGVYYFNRDLFDQYISGNRILIVDDIISSAVTIRGLKTAVESRSPRTLDSGKVVEVVTIFNERGITAGDIGDFDFLALRNFASWKPRECDLCAQHIPIEGDVGMDRSIRHHNW